MRNLFGVLLLAAIVWSCNLNGQSKKSVPVTDFSYLLQDSGTYQLLDVRTADEFKTG